MSKNEFTIVETIEMKHGLEIDTDEAWRKLIERQFGGDPGRAAAELLQNALDSYPLDTPWDERWVKIETGTDTLSMTDFGEGMSRERLTLLLTLGGTDKNDMQHIGRFGIGFFSIFSPALGTQRVRVVTCCEGHVVEMVFTVTEPHRQPTISTQRLEQKIDFRTRIEVTFGNGQAVEQCMTAMRRYLKYYPCRVTVNGRQNRSVWDDARKSGTLFFKQGHCDGFLNSGSGGRHIDLLCKYEYITTGSLAGLITGGRNMTHDIRDYSYKGVPYLPCVSGTVNCNNLNVTISRDGFYLDWPFDTLVRTIGQALIQHLDALLEKSEDAQLVLANQYILRSQIRGYLQKVQNGDAADIDNNAETSVVRRLLEAKVYRINGRRGQFSLLDLLNMRSPGTPVFFSIRQNNLRWLGGAYKHDFVILPSRCLVLDGAPDFYDDLFACIFDDIVNLDRIAEDNNKIRKLVERGIIDKEALMPECRVIGDRQVNDKEAALLREIDVVLAHPQLRKAITQNLHLRIGGIRSVLFDVREKEVTIATGIFDESGRAVGEDNRVYDSQDVQAADGRQFGPVTDPDDDEELLLGLRRDHPFIEQLIESNDPHRAYYGLTFLAHELALCQKRLVPYSQFFHLVKERLAADMRRALMMQLIGDPGKEAEAA